MFEFEYETADKRKEFKIFFFLYAPDVCSANDKFVFASTKSSIQKKVSPVHKEVQVNDWADLEEEKLLRAFKS